MYFLHLFSKSILDKYFLDDVFNQETGEVIVERSAKIDDKVIAKLKSNGIKEVELASDEKDHEIAVEVLMNTIEKDPTNNTFFIMLNY